MGADLVKQCALSGEPLIKEVQRFIPPDSAPVPIPLLSLEALALRKQDFQDRYIDYWQGTSEETETGRQLMV